MRSKIVEKASQLFLQLGFKTVTMDDIAAELAMSKKTIYSHFNNKKELVTASIESLVSQISEGAEKIYGSHENPVEEFFLIRDYIIKTLENEEPIARYQLEKYYPEIFREIQLKQLDLVMRCITENLIRGKELQLYRGDLDIPFASRMYYSAMISIRDPMIFSPEEFKLEHLFDKVINHFLIAICTKTGLKILEKHLETI